MWISDRWSESGSTWHHPATAGARSVSLQLPLVEWEHSRVGRPRTEDRDNQAEVTGKEYRGGRGREGRAASGGGGGREKHLKGHFT